MGTRSKVRDLVFSSRTRFEQFKWHLAAFAQKSFESNYECKLTDYVIFWWPDADYANIDSKTDSPTLSLTVNIRTINFPQHVDRLEVKLSKCKQSWLCLTWISTFCERQTPFALCQWEKKLRVRGKMKELGNKTYKKLQKIFANNKDDMIQLLNSYESLTTSKITLDEFAKSLSFKSPTELDALKLI